MKDSECDNKITPKSLKPKLVMCYGCSREYREDFLPLHQQTCSGLHPDRHTLA